MTTRPLGNSAESIGELFHKKKEAKKKQKTKGQLTIGEGSTEAINTQTPNAQKLKEQLDNRQQAKSKTKSQILNEEIDEFLFNLVAEGLINPDFVAWYAKACRTLGIAAVNRLAINARNGNKPDRLFASKVKGQLNLYWKREFFKD